MKTSELIERLKELDPSGEMECVTYSLVDHGEIDAYFPGGAAIVYAFVTKDGGKIEHPNNVFEWPNKRKKGFRKIKVIVL